MCKLLQNILIAMIKGTNDLLIKTQDGDLLFILIHNGNPQCKMRDRLALVFSLHVIHRLIDMSSQVNPYTITILIFHQLHADYPLC